MKIQFLGLLLAAILAPSLARTIDAENELGVKGLNPVNPIVEKILEVIRKKIPDPFTLDKISINLPVPDVADGFFNLTDIYATGLGGWDTKVESSMFALKLSILVNIKNVNINNRYCSDLEFLDLLPIYGAGRSNVHIQDLSFNLTSKFKLKKDGLWLSNTTFVIKLGDATFDIHGLMYNEPFSIEVSQIYNDIVASFVNTHGDIFTRIISPIIENIFNGVLHPKKKNDTAPAYVKQVIKFLNLDDSVENDVEENELVPKEQEYFISKQSIVDMAKLAYQSSEKLTEEEKKFLKSLENNDFSSILNLGL